MSKSEISFFLLRHFILFKEKYDDLKKKSNNKLLQKMNQ